MRIILILLLALLFGQSKAQNIFDSYHTRIYAEYLQNKFDYSSANKEYLHYLRFDSTNDTIIHQVAENFYYLKNYESSFTYLNRLNPTYKLNNTNTGLLFVNTCRKINKLDSVEQFLKHYHSNNLEILQIWKLEYKLRQVTYSDYYSYVKYNKNEFVLNEDLQNLYSQMMLFPPKSPVKASILAIVPGLGKIYTKNYQDAKTVIMSVILSSFQAYRGFSKVGIKSPYAWIFGGIGVGFYFGSIYGSYKSAKKYNQSLKELYIKNFEKITFSHF